jgi:hypothetical protein
VTAVRPSAPEPAPGSAKRPATTRQRQLILITAIRRRSPLLSGPGTRAKTAPTALCHLSHRPASILAGGARTSHHPGVASHIAAGDPLAARPRSHDTYALTAIIQEVWFIVRRDALFSALYGFILLRGRGRVGALLERPLATYPSLKVTAGIGGYLANLASVSGCGAGRADGRVRGRTQRAPA